MDIILGVITKLDSIQWSFLCILGSSTEWGIFIWAAKISNIFGGCLKFLIFFGVKGRYRTCK